MNDANPVPRPNFFTVADIDAWEQQFHVLFYVLGMTAYQIAQVDHGFDPDESDAWLSFPWAQEIELRYSYIDVRERLQRRD